MEAARAVAERFRATYGVAAQVVASAPGRVNLIGEHTDYNDGFVLPMAIDRRLLVAASTSGTDRDSTRSAGDYFEHDRGAHPRSLLYMAGVMWALRRDHPELSGTDAYISGDLPVGAGLASSAALEIAYARALCETSSITWEPMVMARLAQEGEISRLGVRCGIMDQAASAAGRKGHAMLLDCRSLTMTHVQMPEAFSVVVMDTGTRRRLGETEYNVRRESCETAVKAIQKIDASVKALRDATLDMLAKASLDDMTSRRARHVIEENARPAAMVKALQAGDGPSAGALMNDSHSSLRALYEVSSMHLDLICEAAREHPGCLGARMTGGGFGGCAIALVRADAAEDFIAFVQPRYEAKTYKKSAFFTVHPDDGARIESVP